MAAPRRAPRISEQEWRQLTPWISRLQERRRTAAHRYLVDGLEGDEAGAPFSMTRQDVYNVVKIVLRYYERLKHGQKFKAPSHGWVNVSFSVPKNQVSALRKIVAAFAAKAELETQEKKAKRSRARPGGSTSGTQ